MSGRIGKIRMKDGGAELRIIPCIPEPETDPGARLLGAARSIAADEDLIGYVVIGLTEGGFLCGFRWDDERSQIPRTLFPSYMAEVLRRELITDVEAAAVFDSKFEWVE